MPFINYENLPYKKSVMEINLGPFNYCHFSHKLLHLPVHSTLSTFKLEKGYTLPVLKRLTSKFFSFAIALSKVAL